MQKILQKGLSLIVSFQMLLAMVPTGFAAEASLKVLDTTAGKPALIMVNGLPDEVIELTITNPFKSVVKQNFKLNSEGFLQYWYPQAVVAGDYQVAFSNHNARFSVIPGLPDPFRSQFELSDYTAYTGKTIEGTLTLKDQYGNLIKGRALEVNASSNTTVNCLNSCQTNNSGSLYFSLRSQKAGLKKLTIVDKEHDVKIYQEDIGFIPYVQQPIQTQNYGAYTNPYVNDGSQQQYLPYSSANTNTWQGMLPDANFDYLPLYDPNQATYSARGNNDQLLNSSWNGDVQSLLGANILSPQWLAQAQTGIQTNTPGQLVQNSGAVDHLEILFGNDNEAEFKENVTVSAQTALDLIVKAVNAQGKVVETYTGEVEFELSSGGLVPNDYKFSEVDKGMALFELALVLPAGDYTFTVQDKDNPSISGEVSISSQFKGAPNLNNTNVQLTIESPIANSVYAKDFSVQGNTNTDNTEIVVKEGPLELKRGPVDENKRFNFVLDLSDGNHTLEITAIYLPDGSETSATVPLEVDKTAPVITQVTIPEEPVRAGEQFSVSAIADERSKVQIFINNRSYDLVSKGGQQYSLNANAPLDPGTYPVHARATDELGNITESPDVGTLTVVPGLQEISNLFGVPGVESITLSWAPVEGAASYDVSYKSILGEGQQSLNTTEPRITVQNLGGNLSYIFTVTAKNAQGEDLSKATQSRAIKALTAPVTTTEPEVTITLPDEVTRPAADVKTAPARHTSSGPEVYLLIIASLIVLNIYGKARKVLAIND